MSFFSDFQGINGAAARSCSPLGWSEVTSNGSPRCEVDSSEGALAEDDDDLNNEEEDQNQDRMSGASSPRSPYGNMAKWEPLSLSAKENSPSEDLHRELPGSIGRVSNFPAEALRYRLLSAEEDSEGEAERPPRLDSWALGLRERGLDMSRGSVNLSLLEQAIALQTEQRQVLHHAYREMDRFLMEQMTSERRTHRMMDMDCRLNYNGGKGISALLWK